MTNRLYYGDNLDVLREHVASGSVDLVYLDPPFNSNANYNILFKSPTGSSSDAQIEAFEDTWHWNDRAEDAFDRRRDYGEDRFITFGLAGERLVVIVWTPRDGARDIISMRKANDREQARYRTRLG